MYDHQTHVLKAHLGESCGGTEPPTIGRHNSQTGELFIDIYPSGTNLHVGNVAIPDRTIEFLVGKNFGPHNIGAYALTALVYTTEL